jgi:hypothetical protein
VADLDTVDVEIRTGHEDYFTQFSRYYVVKFAYA